MRASMSPTWYSRPDEAEVLLDRDIVEQVRLVRDEGEQRFGRHRLRRQVVGADLDPAPGGDEDARKLRIVVVLPAPFGPTRPRTSPGSTRNDRPRTAGRSPYSFSSPSTWITGTPPSAHSIRGADR